MPAFLVEDGDGLELATSYVSVAFADDYISVNPTITSWSDLTTEEKETYLMWATRLLDQRVVWAGTRYSADSGLRWPRSGVYDRDNLLIPYDVIPQQLQEVTAEVAFYLISQGIDPAGSQASSSAIKRIKADVIEIEYKDDAVITAASFFPNNINMLLFPLGYIRGLGGNNFVKVVRT